MNAKKLAEKKAYIAGYIKHLNDQIEEYGKSTPDFIPTAKKRIAAFENCLKTKSCVGCIMAKSCGYSTEKGK
jgi:hypothetical protein